MSFCARPGPGLVSPALAPQGGLCVRLVPSAGWQLCPQCSASSADDLFPLAFAGGALVPRAQPEPMNQKEPKEVPWPHFKASLTFQARFQEGAGVVDRAMKGWSENASRRFCYSGFGQSVSFFPPSVSLASWSTFWGAQCSFAKRIDWQRGPP